MNLASFMGQEGSFPFVFYLVFVWSLFWKGIALWRAAQLKQKYWFVVMLVISTIGILELIYLFRFAKKRLTFVELKGWFMKDEKK